MHDHSAKTVAQALRTYLTAHGLNPLGQQRALQVIAALHGTDWNTLSAQPSRPRLAPPADAQALQRALRHYDVDVSSSWAQAAIAHLDGQRPDSVAQLPVSAPVTDPVPLAIPLLDRDTVYRAVPKYQSHPIYIDRRSRLTTPWPLLPLPAQVSPALRQQLWRAHLLEWTPETGLLIDGAAPVMSLPTLGPGPLNETIKAWLKTLENTAPDRTTTYEGNGPARQLIRLTVPRLLEVPACLTYQAQSAYGRSLMADARRNLTLSYDGATTYAAQAKRYDAFITECALDGRGSRALRSHEIHRLTDQEDQVLRAFPDRRPRIRDHSRYWKVAATGQLVLTYEPYMVMGDPEIQTEADAFRQTGWTVTVRRAAYAPGIAMIMLGAPA
ncbi:hypothetical protein GO986_21965 [Deinococcus sp. HMF7620]|uniref:Uncharacterized protein n=1 Tax=Deinococcus arboris TaxID=2682977 RepID=A0A7C9MBV5_9DEIO|nr:hypothetical protein [Deinococcus arboris]MVN89403.1 hypothetical protein [Deinococcus arboris]